MLQEPTPVWLLLPLKQKPAAGSDFLTIGGADMLDIGARLAQTRRDERSRHEFHVVRQDFVARERGEEGLNFLPPDDWRLADMFKLSVRHKHPGKRQCVLRAKQDFIARKGLGCCSPGDFVWSGLIARWNGRQHARRERRYGKRAAKYSGEQESRHGGVESK